MATYRLQIGGVFSAVAHRDINLSPFDVERLLWSMVIGYLFLNSLPGSSTLIGAGIVALAGIFTLWCDQRQRRAHIARASS